MSLALHVDDFVCSAYANHELPQAAQISGPLDVRLPAREGVTKRDDVVAILARDELH